MPVGVKMPPRPYPPALIRSMRVHFTGNHLLLSLRVEADVAHDRFPHELCADELANARARHGGVIGNDRKISLSLAHNLIHEALRCADTQEPPDQQASTVGDQIDRLAERCGLHFSPLCSEQQHFARDSEPIA